MDGASLEELVAKVAREELREDENTREQALEQFRDWILKNPDIRDCKTDDSFLVPFLRVRKYSLPMAEETLLRFLRFQKNFPELNSNLDIENGDVNEIISSGYVFSSPFREISDNSAVIIYLIDKLDIKKFNYVSAVQATLLTIHTILRNEASQVMGVTFVVDYSQVSAAFFTFHPFVVVKAIMESLQKALPIRIKKLHFANMPPVAAFFLKFLRSVSSEKLQNRFSFSSSLEELHQKIDPKVLPRELGGTMPMDEMIGLWKKELAAHREAILALKDIKLLGDSFNNDLESNETGIPGISGSFRKLAVD